MSDPNSEGAPQDNESESKADETAVQPEQQEHGPDDPAQHGRHELPPHQPHPEIGELRPRGFLGTLRRGQNAQARLAALSILIGTVGATGPGVTVRIEDPGPGVAPQAMLDVIDELRAAGAEAIQIGDDHQAVRAGVDTWIVGAPGALTVDGKTLMPPYSVLAIGDPPTLAAAMNIPGGAVDSVKRVGGTMSVQQGDKVDITALRQPKPRQYAQPGK
jgi:uncharacterized protein YlxW (UPF0749 family)